MKLTLRGVVFSALFAAILVLFSFAKISLPLTPVPITLQTLAVMLAGGLLGARYGFLSMALVVVLTAIGFPLLHGNGGLGVVLGPTGGFIMIWPISAMLIGLILPRIRMNGIMGYIAAFLVLEVFGSLILYLAGVPWLMYKVPTYTFAKAMAAACYPFLIGDAIKAVVAALIIAPVRQVFPPQRLTGSSSHSVVKSNSPTDLSV
ncbi:biotin transporter BioY [Paenibacillus alginolyticus]|uniref:Biotin transporter n=1 Tax=Paenibacillus alginolyticus TaxID=59839 RepID=A0ABT4G9N9_9BACL|nr:biotin transporter BioY [Paenibacillus alginolyticus]MCY9668689.1 biotin transporter BioY [Paenibacillus alginolyticus]MCY9692877.1 biotin transporter BioY [Paenibacillus alginolyticus]MEC0148782.1 biotin transporter BioY [Paenibacillus alginolyticus]